MELGYYGISKLDLESYSQRLHSQIGDDSEDSQEERKVSDPVLKSLSDLMDLAIECNQHEMKFDDDYEDKPKVCLIRIRMSKKEIERNFGIKPVSVYGMGLFLPIEGITLGPSTRNLSKYDESLVSRRVMFNLSSIPEDIIKTHEFRLAIPAGRGLFIPKKSPITGWINSTKCIKFLDLNLNN